VWSASSGIKEDELAMRTEIVLRRVAIGCAVFLLFGPLGGRTMWVGGHTTATDAAGYNMVALLCGVVVLAALAVALWMRERQTRALPALGALVAVAAFGLTAYVSGIYVWARLQGQVWGYAGWSISEGMVGRNETVYPASGPPFFTLAALIGAVATLALAVGWLLSYSSGPRTSPRTST
jgi:hypothetical protein